MAVAYDNSLTAKNGTNNTTWASGNLSFGTLTNPAAFLLFAWANTAGTPRTVSSMQLDPSGQNVAMPLFNGIAAALGAGRPDIGVALYSITGSGATLGSGNHAVTATMSGNTRWKAGLFLSAQGVDQTTPLAGFVSDQTDIVSPNALSPTGSPTVDDMLIAGLLDFDGNGTATMAGSTNTTQRGTTQTDTSVFGLMFVGGTAAGNASSIGFTWTAATANNAIAAAIKAASASGFNAGRVGATKTIGGVF